jgi:hypothetical protein
VTSIFRLRNEEHEQCDLEHTIHPILSKQNKQMQPDDYESRPPKSQPSQRLIMMWPAPKKLAKIDMRAKQKQNWGRNQS